MNDAILLNAFDGMMERLRLRDHGIEFNPFASGRSDRNRRTPENPSTKRTPLSWLMSVTSGLDIGKKVFSKKRNAHHPVHLNSNDDIKRHFERLRWGATSWLKHRWSNKVIEDHCFGDATYYFAGASESYKPYSLTMIDVDCHNSGCLDGALSLLQNLRDQHFPNLYFEPSTNGNGGHGYFLLDKEEMGSQGIKPILSRQLDPWLNELAADFDVELVEVKGLPPELTWGSDQYELLTYKSGCLAKVPRGLIDRFDELKHTTVVTASELRRLPVIEREAASVVLPLSSSPKSISGCHFQREQLDGLKEGGQYYSVAAALMSGEEWKTSSRACVTVMDMAIMLMIGEFLTGNMNSDGSMPTARWEMLWKSLSKSGDVGRAWDHKRFKLLRDRLSCLGLIDWENSSYRLGWTKDNGEYVKGTAAKWKFSVELMEKLSGSASLATSSVSGEKKKHPLWEQHLLEWRSGLQLVPDNVIIRPTWVQEIEIYRYSPDELTQYVTPILKLAA